MFVIFTFESIISKNSLKYATNSWAITNDILLINWSAAWTLWRKWLNNIKLNFTFWIMPVIIEFETVPFEFLINWSPLYIPFKVFPVKDFSTELSKIIVISWESIKYESTIFSAIVFLKLIIPAAPIEDQLLIDIFLNVTLSQ